MANFTIHAVDPLTKTKKKYTLKGEAKFVSVDERKEQEIDSLLQSPQVFDSKIDIALEDVKFEMREEQPPTKYRVFWRDGGGAEIILAHTWRFRYSPTENEIIEFLDENGEVEDVFFTEHVRGVVKVIEHG